MAYKSPFAGMFAAAEDEDGSDSKGNAGYKSSFTGMFSRRKKRDEERELAAQEAAYNVETIKQEQAKKADEEKAKKNASKNILERAGDVKRGVGGFIKDAAVDIKDTTVGTWQGLGDVGRGVRAGESMKRISKEQNEMNQRHTKEMNEILGDAEDATKLDPERKAKWDEYVARSNKERADFKAKTEGAFKEADEDIDTMQKVDAKKLAFQSAETALNIGTLGITSIPKQIVKQAAKVGIKAALKQTVKTGGTQALKQVIKEGGEQFTKKAAQEALEASAKTGGKKLLQTSGKAALEGTAYGVTYTGRSNPDADLDDYLINMAFGAGFGFALPVAGAGIKKGAEKVVGKIRGTGSSQVASKAADAVIPEEQLVPDSVVQIKNAKTGELTYQRIPKDKYDDIVREIDGDRVTTDGIAGKADADGNIYHITASSPEKMAKAGFKDGGVYGGTAATKAAGRTPDVDLNEFINQSIDEQSDKYGQNVLTRVKNWVGDQIDPYRALAKIDDKYSKANGIKRTKLAAGESLEDLARRSAASERQAATMFETKTKSGMSASDLVKKYKGDSAAGKEFNNYTNMKFLQEIRAKKKNYQLPAGLTDENIDSFIKSYEAKNADAVKDLVVKKEINDMAVDYLEKSGAISKADAKLIKSSYKYAVPLEKIFPDDLARPEVTGRNIGSIAKQTVIQRLETGSDVPINNSFDSMLNRVYKAVSQGNRAKLAAKLLERQEQGIIDAKLVVGAGNKAARKSARATAREINQGTRYLSKRISMTNRQVKRLDKEIAKLNLEGLDASLKAERPTTPGRPVKTVTVKTVAPMIKDNAPKKLDDLKQSYSVKESLLKEYGPGEKGIQQMAADIHNGGWQQLMELNPRISKQTAMSIADQILKKPTVMAGKTVVTEGKLGRNPTQKSILKSLIDPATPASQVVAIQKKIATREPKLAAKLDEVINYKAQIDANNAAKVELKGVVAELADDPTTGKQVVSGVIDGEPYKMEVPPELAKALMGLDQQKLPSVLKAFAIAKKPFEIAWTGIINPVFTGISFALYDTPMSVINSPQGFRTFGPKAVIEGVKSLRSSSKFQRMLAAEGARPYGGSGASTFIKPDAKSIAAQRSILSNIAYTTTHPEKALSKLDIWGGKLANSTRTRIARAAYDDVLRQAKKAGDDITDIAVQKRAMEQAALAYRTVMPDYDTMSNLTRQINSVVPFYAASTAGTRALGKALKRDPLGTGTKLAALGIAPTVGVTAFSLMSPAGQDFYEDMEASGQERVLNDNMIVVLPGASKNERTGEWSGIIKVPLAPEFRAINQTVWRETRTAMGKGKGPAASHVALSLFDAVTGGVRTSQNPLIDTVRILAGQDPRTGEQLVKGDMANLPKEEQVYETTSGAGKYVSKILNTSPIQGDKFLGQFGLAGQTVKNGGKPVEAITENVQNRVSGAYGDKAASAFFDTYSPIKTRRDKVSREVTDLVKAGKLNEAKRKAADFNETLPGSFSKFSERFKDSDAYDPMWDEMLNGLMIKTSEASFKSRKKS